MLLRIKPEMSHDTRLEVYTTSSKTVKSQWSSGMIVMHTDTIQVKLTLTYEHALMETMTYFAHLGTKQSENNKYWRRLLVQILGLDFSIPRAYCTQSPKQFLFVLFSNIKNSLAWTETMKSFVVTGNF